MYRHYLEWGYWKITVLNHVNTLTRVNINIGQGHCAYIKSAIIAVAPKLDADRHNNESDRRTHQHGYRPLLMRAHGEWVPRTRVQEHTNVYGRERHFRTTPTRFVEARNHVLTDGDPYIACSNGIDIQEEETYCRTTYTKTHDAASSTWRELRVGRSFSG